LSGLEVQLASAYVSKTDNGIPVVERKFFKNNHLKVGISARGGLEPGFWVPFSLIFHSIAQGNCHQRGKLRKVVEAKLLQSAASLRTLFVLVISARALKSLVPFLGYS
jgi:hypothetical protein